MKKLNFEEMENLQAGIACAEINDVLFYLECKRNYQQIAVINMMYFSLQCFDDNGNATTWRDYEWN
jgi:hypothetical protein